MKAVLISINPKWCELIANGKKTVEVRKTKPKIETPFKCYIYCTKGKPLMKTPNNSLFIDGEYIEGQNLYGLYELVNGKVIGEFVCDEIHEVYQCNSGWVQEKACIPRGEFFDYLGIPRYTHFGYDKKAYAWNISNLVIYDKPRELREFRRYSKTEHCGWGECDLCRHGDYDQIDEKWFCRNHITRPPQSWCYLPND